MTRKRYRGLGRELIRRIMTGAPGGKLDGHMQRTFRDLSISNTVFRSYQEAWDSIKSIREQYNM